MDPFSCFLSHVSCHDCGILLIFIINPLASPAFFSAFSFSFFPPFLNLLFLWQSFEFDLFCFFFSYSLFNLRIRVYGFNWNILSSYCTLALSLWLSIFPYLTGGEGKRDLFLLGCCH